MNLFTRRILSLDRFKHKQADSEVMQFGRDARTDWKVACATTLIFLLIAVVVSIVIFERVHKGEFFLSEKKTETSSLSLNRFELETTIHFYEKKQEQFEALLRRPIPTADPFIPKAKPEGN